MPTYIISCILTALVVSLIWFFIVDFNKCKLQLEVRALRYKLRAAEEHYENLLVQYLFLTDKFGIKNKPVDPLTNAYQILGLDDRASLQEVKNKYRMLVKKYHPDKLQSVDTKKFREINDAYALIKKSIGH